MPLSFSLSVKSSNLQHKNRQYLKNQQTVLSSPDSPCQTVLSSPDSPCQTVLKFLEINARQFWNSSKSMPDSFDFFGFLFTPVSRSDSTLKMLLKIFEHCKWQIYFKVNMHPQMYLQKLASKSRDLLDRSSLPWTSGLGTLTTALYITQFFWAPVPDFAMEEKKFGLLLLPEVHRRPGEGDLEGKRSAWWRVLIWI